jgi:hypothetical protein
MCTDPLHGEKVWDVSSTSIAPDLINKGYDIVISNSDLLYLDCGGPGWVRPGGYW